MLLNIEQTRLAVSRRTDRQHKAKLGQFFTPEPIARFMANLLAIDDGRGCRLLDAGAGIGSLTSAFLARRMELGWCDKKVHISAFEIDEDLHENLSEVRDAFAGKLPLSFDIFGDDFIEHAVNQIQFEHEQKFTHAILNPPYKKIASSSRHRSLLRQAGIETVNAYSAFVALSLEMLAPNGRLVAIIPRSFCNGPYYKPFRDFILQRAAIRHIHLFDSRSKAFNDDAVLQENVILLLERDAQQTDVTVTTSTDGKFQDVETRTHPFHRIVSPDDTERFIHIPTTHQRNAIELSSAIRFSLLDIGIKVSTGPVVDFRLKTHLRQMPESGTVPLLYPAHFAGANIEWPRAEIKKPNAIVHNADTEKWLYPNGFYCVVRRFSSKEEKRRVVASAVQPQSFEGSKMLGFENHLNVYHDDKHGLPEALARGLSVYLNTTGVDENFRRSSGHTQVNATDLKMMKYPSRSALIALGEWAIACAIDGGELTQVMMDEQLNHLHA